MQRPRKAPAQNKRERYCEIKATSLEEILETCNRHIKNIGLTQLDMIEEGDLTDTDEYYCNMFRDAWADLRDDVTAIIEKQKAHSTSSKYIIHVVEAVEHASGWGSSSAGYVAFLTRQQAEAFVDEEMRHRSVPTPAFYTNYIYVGAFQCSAEIYAGVAKTKYHLTTLEGTSKILEKVL